MEFVPHNYQSFCIDKITNEPAVGLFLDMGLGKTVITLTAINDLKYNRFMVTKALVIAPKRVAQSTWTNEAGKWDHLKLLRIIPVIGSLTQRLRALHSPGDVYVINRENVPWLVEYFRNAWPFDTVIVDESSSFKNPKSKRFKSLTWVRKQISRMVLLTGTPAPNGLMDLWAQVYLLDEGARLGKFITHFKERFFDPDKRSRDRIFTYKLKPGGEETLQKLISDLCISMKSEDYLELPDCITVDTPVLLDSKAQRAYDELEHKMLLELDESTIDASSAAALTNKLLQLSNGAVYDENKAVVIIHDCKLEAFLELIESLNGQSALVFYNFRHDITRIKEALYSQNKSLTVKELVTPADEADWNMGKIDILLAHPASCAYGLNLQQGGHHAIWFGLNWSLELYQQANKRLHRQGQTHPVILHRLFTKSTRDEDVISALCTKQSTQETLLNSLKARITAAKQKALKGQV